MSDTMHWADVDAALRLRPPGAQIVLARHTMPHPRTEGAVPAVGLPQGQIADWRFPPAADCHGLHVHEYVDRWVAHLDRVHPDCDPVEHLRRDAPAVFVGATAVLGAIVGVLADRRRRKRGLAIGLVLGTGLGALVTSLKPSK